MNLVKKLSVLVVLLLCGLGLRAQSDQAVVDQPILNVKKPVSKDRTINSENVDVNQSSSESVSADIQLGEGVQVYNNQGTKMGHVYKSVSVNKNREPRYIAPIEPLESKKKKMLTKTGN